ncbi:Protein O-mannosyl-transferase TMTC2 [Gryllus bimaculatus]|nr:Protein O-mannosyl-transferase TMTC2 [Gryllus bimaculatus]
MLQNQLKVGDREREKDKFACVILHYNDVNLESLGTKPVADRGDTEDGHVWLSVVFGGVSMLAKETGITVLVVNLLYDFYRSWHSIKRSLLEVRWNDDTQQFARRAAKILMSLSVLLVFRLAMLQGSLPRFSNQDNPAAFHPSRLVRFLTFCYLAAFNCWLLLCPATLSHDWQMGSVPLVASLGDARNLATALFFLCCLVVLFRCLMDFEPTLTIVENFYCKANVVRIEIVELFLL